MKKIPIFTVVCFLGTATITCAGPTNNLNILPKFFQNDAHRAFHAKFLSSSSQNVCTILSMNWIQKFNGFKHDDSPEALHVTKKAAIQPLDSHGRKSCDVGVESQEIFEIFGKREDIVRAHVDFHCPSIDQKIPRSFRADETPEICKIVDSGDQSNRIDVVFMGDGYTLEERDKFFQDMERLTKEMFEGITFRSYLPLFNIWAIFVPSVDSGIGYDGPKNTPFKLYREKGQLRVINTDNPTYARQVCEMTGRFGCDFPSLIANDNYYGGVGGEFVISTRSNRTGLFVLRHEMGHSFINEGDEYDNSFAYYGYNSAETVADLGWSHWLTGEQREERAIYRILAYPWKDLSTGEETINFSSDGKYARWYLWASVSAAGEADSLEFELDGEILPWTTTGFDDREFYSWRGTTGFSAGNHTLVVRSKTPSTNPDVPRMICSVNLHEYGTEDEFVISNDHVSAYPVWDDVGKKHFRPTNIGCLMRDVTLNVFCPVCKEGMWYEFFRKVSLIDNVTVTADPENPEGARMVTLTTLKLAHLRPPGSLVEGEQLKTTWFVGNDEVVEFKDKFVVSILPGEEPKNWTVKVEFVTPEVRVDPENLLKDQTTFSV